ncbi:hypothetical protein GK047_11860 [Paenibacillus sp. SYP-B3998]|uniref:Uncharacterized protein n=1 Tax=Paenibacillus sp. SYP-B3998 TaxID=2678564 RepID=A0A6G3ZXA4_9BACL|nr:hypothetical protein [Paenibacillus sp. SYP-B3998]NEW06710.1 hypothetical protein [Paenibacillus sp. SYP-B3998]
MSILKNAFLVIVMLIVFISGMSGMHATALAAHEHGDSVMASEGQSLGEKITNLTSIVLVSMATLFFIVRIRGSAKHLSKMTGMMAAMATSMMASVVIGTILGLLLKGMFLSTVVGVVIGVVIGFFAGQTLSQVAALDGMMSGVMGGMMGPMLGVMVLGDHPVLTVLFMDLVFAVMMIALYQFLITEVRASLVKQPN